MSHLSLDARTVLEYLNELGYRNLTAEQLKEFLKGMQRQSEYNKNNDNNNKQQTSTTAGRSGKNKGSCNSANISTSHEQTATPATTTATATSVSFAKSIACQQQKQLSKQKNTGPNNGVSPVKIIKSKKPLCHFKFYLDICDHQTAKKIEDQITRLGGALEFFLTSNVTHFITDKTVLPPTVGDNNNTLSSRPGTPQTPSTPGTPKTPYSIESLANTPTTTSIDSKCNAINSISRITRQATSGRQSRADAILSRARRQSSTAAAAAAPTTLASPIHIKNITGATEGGSTGISSNATSSKSGQLYTIWQTDQALRFFKKVQTDLKEYIEGSRERKQHSSKSYAFGPTHLKNGYIKIESLKRNYRPYYHLFKKPAEWPKIDLSREDGAFRLSPKKQIENENPENQSKMTRKSRSQSSQRPIQPPVQALKKGEINQKSSVGGQRNSNACKQVKESSDKQCGVCEICKIEYDTLAVHLKTKDHEFFAKNTQNFIALDTLIRTSANVKNFLGDDRKSLLEEMEVEEDLLDDLEEKDPLGEMHGESKRFSSDSHKTPSPTLRERSKRSTKGKHSSEKFLNTPHEKTNSKGTSVSAFTRSSPLKSASVSPQRKLPLPPPSALLLSSSVPAHPSIIEVITTNTVTKTTSAKAETTAADGARKKTETSVVLSPPIRPKLPLSSMYKVVETQEIRTPTRKTRGDALAADDATDLQQTVASPSLIVKFKKVRQNDICRLSGEAEGFMFPKHHTSSELSTDIDRQTTSDNAFRTNLSASMSSTSLDSNSELHTNMDIESEKTERSSQTHSNSSKNAPSSSVAAAFINRKAIAKAKRRKNSNSAINKVATIETENQNFPEAPIQPEVQLKNLRSGKVATTITTPPKKSPVKSTTPAVTTNITLPEATRKSSRTATAIVTAATTSSRLLRAAVEAARKAHEPATVERTSKPLTPMKKTQREQIKIATPVIVKRNSLTVVKLEDRMGDDDEDDANDNNKDDNDNDNDDNGYGDGDDDDDDNDNSSIKNKLIRRSRRKKPVQRILQQPILENTEDESDENHADDDGDDCMNSDNGDDDAGSDGDHNVSIESQNSKCVKKSPRKNSLNASLSTREERALRRQNQKVLDELVIFTEVKPAKPRKSQPKKLKISKAKPKKKNETKKRSSQNGNSKEKKLRGFDFTKSERISSSRYAFERVPIGDPWYKAYERQDNSVEKYFEYYGSTNYRKLPYELGPIPLNRAMWSCCKICQGSNNPWNTVNHSKNNVGSNSCPDSSKVLNLNGFKIKEESARDSKDANDERRKSIGDAEVSPKYSQKHKKILLLQRYHEEQQQLLKTQKQQQKEDEDEPMRSHNLLSHEQHLNLNSLTCDSKASTPDRVERERERERAGSIHSNDSSCASSSTATNNSRAKYRNKHLSRASFLSLEIPPRKSPREHASTLALVSCIIRQRQDSISKTNSECDDASAPNTPTPMLHDEDNEREGDKSKIKLSAALTISTADIECTETSTSIKTETRVTPNAISQQVKELRLRSPKPTRSAASTPIEELRFTSEISENVKRMRRGQNKYDHSPPINLKSPRSARVGCRSSTIASPPSLGRSASNATSLAESVIIRRRRCPNLSILRTEMVSQPRERTSLAMNRTRRRRPKNLSLPLTASSRIWGRNGGNSSAHSFGNHSNKTAPVPSIRKTGSKKGVLEFEVDASALAALDKAIKYTDNKRLEWQIDKYLQSTGKDYDIDSNDLCLPAVSTTENATEILEDSREAKGGNSAENSRKLSEQESRSSSIPFVNTAIENNKETHFDINTPPPTDCAFSSDFDLCDLFTCNTAGLVPLIDDDPMNLNKSSVFSIFNSQAVQNYFRSKRKCQKSNRTGWPKVQKKKVSVRQQKLMRQKIRFLHNGNNAQLLSGNEGADPGITQGEEHIIKIEFEQNNDNNSCDSRVGGDVMTPPYTDDNDEKMVNGDDTLEEALKDDERADGGEVNNDNCDVNEEEYFEEANETEMGDESMPEEEDAETLADSVEYDEQTRCDAEDVNVADIEGADADAEVDDDEDDDDDEDEAMVTADEAEDDDHEEESLFEEKFSNLRRKSEARSPDALNKVSDDTLQQDREDRKSSTPTTNTPFLRALRRTPTVLLSGSLGSCVSPSEKAGDNSDIFTVSSDGLDTDLDMSNSHTHFKNNSGHGDDDPDSNRNCPHRTPTRRRLDISKYTPANRSSKTCAAEAATAAVKSLAISQYLKKEVRVTCRRLKPPFRKFRYRR